MRVTAILLISLLGVIVNACRPSAAPLSISNEPVSINGKPAPITKAFNEMSWKNDDGATATVGSLKGKVAILDFWATNCPPCREEIPHLNSLLAKYGKNDLSVIGLHVGDLEDKQKIPAFTAQTQLDYPIAFPDDQLTRLVFMNTSEIPQTFIVDRTGKITARFTGFSPQIRQEMDDAVQKAVNSTN